jgi:hypothetical protein
MRDDGETEDYEVGYRKPPKSGQFKKGVSGNPSGRPKRASDVGSNLIRAFNEKVTITENGERKVITKGEAAMKQLANKAANGHLPSIRLAVPYYQEALEKDAEQQWLANRSLRELTKEELMAIAAGGKEKLADERE